MYAPYFMDKNTYYLVVGLIFLIIAVVHLLRVFYGWNWEIGGWAAPLWVSWLAVVVGGLLSYQSFQFRK